MSSLLNRREVLAGLGVAAVGSAAAPGVAAADPASVRGSWIIQPVTPQGSAGFHAVAAFAAGGVFITTGSDEPGTGIGEWDQSGANGFGFTYLNFHFDPAGKLANTVNVRALGTFSGSQLSGNATETTLAPNGNKLSPDRQFTFTGKRVVVQAP
jgi:hypothetical protein